MEEKSGRAGGGPQTPITMAMRQAGEEAARKADDRKQQDTASGKSCEIGSETLQKLDHSAPIPPPSGTTDASSAITPGSAEASAKTKSMGVESAASSTSSAITPGSAEASAKSKSMGVESAASSTSSVNSDAMDVPKAPVLKHRGSNVSSASAEEIRSVEQSLAITEEDEPDEEVKAGCRSTGSMKASTTSRATDTDGQQDLPGSRTQTQPAASAEDAGQSVAD